MGFYHQKKSCCGNVFPKLYLKNAYVSFYHINHILVGKETSWLCIFGWIFWFCCHFDFSKSSFKNISCSQRLRAFGTEGWMILCTLPIHQMYMGTKMHKRWSVFKCIPLCIWHMDGTSKVPGIHFLYWECPQHHSDESILPPETCLVGHIKKICITLTCLFLYIACMYSCDGIASVTCSYSVTATV